MKKKEKTGDKKPKLPFEVACFDRDWAQGIIALAALRHFGNKKDSKKALKMAPGTFQKLLDGLENDVNLDLWIGNGRGKGGDLLPDGEQVLALAEAAFERFDREVEALKAEFSPERGILRVGFSASTRIIVLDAVVEHRKKKPHLQFHLKEDLASRIEQDVERGILDIGVVTQIVGPAARSDAPLSRDVEVDVLLNDTPLGVVGLPKDLPNKTFSNARLLRSLDEPGIVLLAKGLRSRELVDDYLASVGAGDAPIRTETSSVGMMLELVKSGNGLALLHLPSERILTESGLAWLRLSAMGSGLRKLVLVLLKRKARREKEAAREFGELLNRALREHSK